MLGKALTRPQIDVKQAIPRI